MQKTIFPFIKPGEPYIPLERQFLLWAINNIFIAIALVEIKEQKSPDKNANIKCAINTLNSGTCAYLTGKGVNWDDSEDVEKFIWAEMTRALVHLYKDLLEAKPTDKAVRIVYESALSFSIDLSADETHPVRGAMQYLLAYILHKSGQTEMALTVIKKAQDILWQKTAAHPAQLYDFEAVNFLRVEADALKIQIEQSLKPVAV